MANKPLFHDLVIGGSLRIALAGLHQFDSDVQDTLRIIPKPFDAPRQMADEHVVAVFEQLGALHHLERLELVGTSGPKQKVLVVPAKALTLALQRSRFLKDLLIVGVRVSGSTSDVARLANAVLNHSSLNRMFITDLHSTPGSATLAPFLHAASSNPRVETLAVRHTNWAGQSLYPLNYKACRLKSLRLRGDLCLQAFEWLHFLESLQLTSTLTELRISDCVTSAGVGSAVARLLVAHQSLEDVVLEVATLADTLPICWSLGSNHTLKRLELLAYHRESSSTEAAVISLFADVIGRNFTLMHFLLRTPASALTCPRLDFFLRLNRCVKRALLEQPVKSPRTADWVDALASNTSDVSIMYYILQLNPSLCQLNPSDFKSMPKQKRKPTIHAQTRHKRMKVG